MYALEQDVREVQAAPPLHYPSERDSPPPIPRRLPLLSTILLQVLKPVNITTSSDLPSPHTVSTIVRKTLDEHPSFKPGHSREFGVAPAHSLDSLLSLGSLLSLEDTLGNCF